MQALCAPNLKVMAELTVIQSELNCPLAPRRAHCTVGDWCVQATICHCKQLRSLHIAYKVGKADATGHWKASPVPDASSLLMDFAAALPKLATLQWRDLAAAHAEQRARHMSPAFIVRAAAESPAGSGLRVLQAEQCSFDAVHALPASLQVLSLRMGTTNVRPLREGLGLLLAPCAALRELYVLQYARCRAASVDLPSIAAACPVLRVLVLHVHLEASCEHEVSSSLQSSMRLPGMPVAALFGTPGMPCLMHSHRVTLRVHRPFRLARERLCYPSLRCLFSSTTTLYSPIVVSRRLTSCC